MASLLSYRSFMRLFFVMMCFLLSQFIAQYAWAEIETAVQNNLVFAVETTN
jgi:hypothetical protein